ncbi:UPF0058 family protein [Halorubrum distributum]|uniref:UPF0058 family protein n=1 Tax=Halorubrum distributum TaxID=29283 RepID=UPI002955AF1E|nr:UPF0058 family protein [Halorubrum distributum]MDV7348428.1 UPF0058 family protein [Halorubrum distributum]
MRKKELVQTHALLLEVTRDLIENEEMPAEMITTYYTLDVHPSSVHKSKQNHVEAITVLSNSIERWLEQTHSKNFNRAP